MPHVDLTAAPSGAALPPIAVPDGQAAHAAGFAAVLAGAQSAATGESPSLEATNEPPPDDGVIPQGVTRGDAQLNAWLALSRLALQLTGTASVAVAAVAEQKKPSATAATPEGEPVARATEEASTGSAPATSATAMALLPLPVLIAPVVVPAEESAMAGGEPAAPVATGDGQPGHAAPVAPPSLLSQDVPLPADLETPRGVQLLPEPAVPREPAPAPSMRELLAELRKAAGAIAAPSESGAAPGDTVARALAEGGTAPPTAAADASAQGGNDRRQVVAPRMSAGDRRQAGNDDRATAMAKAIAARFQASDSATTAPASSSAGATVAAGTGRSAAPVFDLPRSPFQAADGLNAGTQATMAFQAPGPTGSGFAATAVGAASPVVPTGGAGETVNDLHSQIVQAMRMQLDGAGGDARIRLQPHFLGDLSISLKVENGGVTAQLAASSPEVRQWIESNEHLLRQSLAQHDLRLDKLIVREDEAAAPRRDDDERQPESRGQDQRRQRRRPDADAATFEVVV